MNISSQFVHNVAVTLAEGTLHQPNVSWYVTRTLLALINQHFDVMLGITQIDLL